MWGSWTPAKVKMAVSGCPRNCAEATCKDFGVICVDSGYEIHFAGAAGLDIKGTELLGQVATEDEALEIIVALTQLYREQGRYLERIYKWIERVGIDVDPPPGRRRSRQAPRALRALRLLAELRPGRSLGRARRRRGHARVRGRWPTIGMPAGGGVSAMTTGSTSALTDIPRRGARCVNTPRRQDRGVPHGGRPGLRPRRPLPAQGRAAEPGHRPRRVVTCPLHNWVIALETGEALGADEGAVRTIPVEGRRRAASSSRSRRCCASRRREHGRRPIATRRVEDHLPLLRRRLRRAGDAARGRRTSPSRGDPEHPANLGRLCSKGSALGETLDLDGRLLHPEIDGARRQLGRGARPRRRRRFAQTIAEHGPDSVAFYVSGQLLTEDYYVANKLMKGFIGSANIDTNSRLCMASSVAGHMRAFGADMVPGSYEDLELADLVVLVGSNLAWCHPVLYQRIAAAKAKRPDMKIVVIDPRRTDDRATSPTCICRSRRIATSRCSTACWPSGRRGRASTATTSRAHTTGFDAALAAAARLDRRRMSPTRPASTRTRSQRFYDLFAATEQDRHRLQPGRQPVGVAAPTRSTRSSTATWPPAASASRAWARSRSPASPTPWAGARSAASPTCWPRTWISRTRRIAIACSASGTRRRIAEQARPEGRRPVPRRRRRADQGALDHGHQPGRLDAGRRPASSGAPRLPVRRRLRRDRPTPTPCAMPMCGCPPPAGARRTARSPIPSAASRASGRFLPLPGEARPDWWIDRRGRAAHGLGARLRLRQPGGDLRRARRACRLRERRHARFRHRRA